jgi:hypothetical protein
MDHSDLPRQSGDTVTSPLEIGENPIFNVVTRLECHHLKITRIASVLAVCHHVTALCAQKPGSYATDA